MVVRGQVGVEWGHIWMALSLLTIIDNFYCGPDLKP